MDNGAEITLEKQQELTLAEFISFLKSIEAPAP